MAVANPERLLPDDDLNAALRESVRPDGWQNPKPEGRYDLLVVGGGPAGWAAAVEGAELGARVALVERAYTGGNHLLNGAIPTACLRRTALNLVELQHAPRYGIIPAGRAVTESSGVWERMRYLRAQVGESWSCRRLQSLGVDVYFGDARFTDPHTIGLDGVSLGFGKAVIATGSSVFQPPIEGLKDSLPLTTDDIFSLTVLPRRLAILGGGMVACEMGQLLARMGVEVTLVVRSRLLSSEDPDVAEVLQKVLERDGVKILHGKLRRVHFEGATRSLVVDILNGQKRVETDLLLSATGRMPNVIGLNLEAALIEYDRKTGLRINRRLQTSNRSVYAAGDICQARGFANAADRMGRVAARNALTPGWYGFQMDTVAWCVHTDPEVARVGINEETATARQIPIRSYNLPLERVDRSITDGEEDGFVRIHVLDGTDRIAGATVVARGADDLIAPVAEAMNNRIGLLGLTNMQVPWPARSDMIRRVADSFRKDHPGGWWKQTCREWVQAHRRKASP